MQEEQDQTQGPDAEPAGDAEIEMPPDPVDATAAARLAAEAAHEQAANMDAYYTAMDKASGEINRAGTAARDAVAEADDEHVLDAIAAAEAAEGASSSFSDIWWAAKGAAEDAADSAELADAAYEATRAIDEGWREAQALANESDGAAAARAAAEAAHEQAADMDADSVALGDAHFKAWVANLGASEAADKAAAENAADAADRADAAALAEAAADATEAIWMGAREAAADADDAAELADAAKDATRAIDEGWREAKAIADEAAAAEAAGASDGASYGEAEFSADVDDWF